RSWPPFLPLIGIIRRERGIKDILSPPEESERLVEDGAMLALRDEDRMQRPIEVIARADARDLDGAYRIDDRRRPDRHAGAAQGAREIDDVLDELACPGRAHSAASTSAFVSSRMVSRRLPSIRAISS